MHATYPAMGYFQCKENHFEIRHAKFEENRKEMPKIESEKTIYNVNQGHNSVLICRNLSICNTKTLLFNINSDTQFEENRQKMSKIESENKFLTSIKGYNSVLLVKIYRSAIREHSFTISTLIRSLKKIGIGMPKIESEPQFLTSIKGRTSALICHNLPICNPRTLLPQLS